MSNKIPFAVGFLGDSDILEIVKNAKFAEDLGFSTCWIAEDYYCGGAFSIATACAENTEKIKIAIGVLNPYTRHPALSAMEASALYKLSGGRLELGLGASNKLWIEQQMGIPFASAVGSLKDTVSIMRGFFRGEEVSLDGEQFHVKGIKPRTPLCPDLPIILGVKSEKMLQMAGQIADGVLLSVGTSVEYVRWVKQQLQTGAAEIGRNIDDFKISAYLLFSIDEDGKLAKERVKTKIAYYLGLHGVHAITLQAGLDPDLLQQFKEGFLKGNYRTDLVTDEIIEKMSISGTPEECRKKLQEMMDAGVKEPVLFQMPEIPIQENLLQVKKYLLS